MERYIIHYRNLKLYRSLGMQVTQIHRALKFRQEAWLAPYIQLNTDLRAKAKSEFEKDFFKLMNNSVYGKTMENLRKRIRVDPVRASENDRIRRLVADPAYLSYKVFDGGLVAIYSIKSKLKLNRPHRLVLIPSVSPYEICLQLMMRHSVIVVHLLIVSQNYSNWTPTLPTQNMN